MSGKWICYVCLRVIICIGYIFVIKWILVMNILGYGFLVKYCSENLE